MKKLIIYLLCCGVLVSVVGCGDNTAPPPTETPLTTVTETTITEAPIEITTPVTTVEPTVKEKEFVPTESNAQATETTMTVAEPTTAEPTEETKTAVTSTAEEKTTPPIEETVKGTMPQHMESKTSETGPAKEEPKEETEPPTVSKPEPTERPASFDVDHWITYARNYAENNGLVLSDTAVDCWDNPIRAGAHCIYLERDIQSRLDRYARDEDITDVWIWAEATDNDRYDIYIGYA